MAPVKPKYLEVRLEGIPQEVVTLPQWLVWKAVHQAQNRKFTKKPIDAKTGKPASSADPHTWADLETALNAYRKNPKKYDGIGIVLTGDDDLVGFDFDHCVTWQDGQPSIDPKVKAMIDTLSSYAEISPSGDGVRVFVFGKLPGTRRKKGDFECYESGRYLTVTGHKLPGAPFHIKRADDAVIKVHEQIFGKAKGKPTQQKANDIKSTLTDEEIKQRIRASKQSSKFSQLFDQGDTSGYPSHSEADLALCSYFAFWCGGDPEQIDRLFRQSALIRDKWDEKHGAETYGQGTIDKAISSCSEFYKASANRDGDISLSEVQTAIMEDEDGDAGIYMRLFLNKFCFDHAMQCWYMFQGHFWELDKTDQATANVEAVIGVYLRELSFLNKQREQALAQGEKEIAKSLATDIGAIEKRILQLHKRDRKKHVVELARTGERSLGISGDEWDQKPWHLGCINGVIDLKTGDIRPGAPEDYIRTIAPVKYKGIDEYCPRWEAFLSDVMDSDQEMVLFLQRLIGYSLIGDVVEHIITVLEGAGRNGKGTMMEALGAILGPLSHKIENELLLRQRTTRAAGSPNSAIVELRGRRLIWASEVGDGRTFDVSRVKELVGGDTLTGRGPYWKRPIEFRPSHTLFLLTNNKPHASADDYAFWKRVVLIPFNLSFVDDPQEPHERQADKQLLPKLLEEKSGILSWLVRGCMEWQRVGLNPPDKVMAAVESYKEDEDLIGIYIEERCVLAENATVKASVIFKDYEEWSGECGHFCYSQTRFGNYLMKSGLDKYKSNGVHYIGIGLRVN